VTQKSYTSPDGLLTLIIKEIDGGDWVIGVDGIPWHVHPDQLLGTYGETVELARESFVSAILNNEEIILVTRKGGKVVDAFVSDNLTLSLEYLGEEELELRFGTAARRRLAEHCRR
jgi:hypothetical protein